MPHEIVSGDPTKLCAERIDALIYRARCDLKFECDLFRSEALGCKGQGFDLLQGRAFKRIKGFWLIHSISVA